MYFGTKYYILQYLFYDVSTFFVIYALDYDDIFIIHSWFDLGTHY